MFDRSYAVSVDQPCSVQPLAVTFAIVCSRHTSTWTRNKIHQAELNNTAKSGLLLQMVVGFQHATDPEINIWRVWRDGNATVDQEASDGKLPNVAIITSIGSRLWDRSVWNECMVGAR
jgi:hypothetical protein